MAGTYLDVDGSDGGRFRAYVATPPQGSGPGLVLLQEIFGVNAFMRAEAARYAEEGYVCFVPDLFWRLEPGGTDLPYDEQGYAKAVALRERFDVDQAVADIGEVMRAVRAHPAHAGGVGCLGFCLGGLLACLAAARLDPDCAVSYYGVGIEQHLDELGDTNTPVLLHIGETDAVVPPEARDALVAFASTQPHVSAHVYPGCGHGFAGPTRDNYDKPATMMAYSRTLALLRGRMGPVFDLSALWDKHCEYEFATRDVDATMATMVAEPYVNHIPTMTGGVGHDHLKRFYKYHFVSSNPPDTRLIPVSRTIGADRVVDEMIFCFTHTCEIPWMLPGVAPTGRYVEIPLVAIVNFRGDKLYHEHIYWDQASVLVQIGALDPAGLPVAGMETAKKLVDETLPSNALMAETWAGSEGEPL